MLQEGDVLVLTKPLGTGAVLKADMMGKGKAGWLQASVSVHGLHMCVYVCVSHCSSMRVYPAPHRSAFACLCTDTIQDATASMLQSNGPAAALLHDVGKAKGELSFVAPCL